MELVYPIYLDTPMMTAFLASLEGGVAEEANIESKLTGSTEKSKKASFKVKVSELISSVIGASAEAELSKRVSDSLDSQYKSTIKFPNATLFIRLRNLLIEQNIIKKVESSKNFDKISIGDIVEIQGLAKPNPSFELRNIVTQLMPVVVPALKIQEMQIENQKSNLKNLPVTRKDKGIQFSKVEGDEINLTELSKYFDNQIQSIQNQSLYLQEVGKTLDILFPEEQSTNLLLDSGQFKSVCKVYPSFARDERIQDIYDAQWRCIAKVIGKVEDDQEYDLFKGLPIGLFAKDAFANLANSLKNEELEINISNPVIKGPTLVLAVLAVFA